MAKCVVTVHCGPPAPERHEALFRQMLREFDPLEIRTLYMVASRFRRNQLESRFLEVFPAVFETPILTLDELVRRLLQAQPILAHRIDEAEKLGLLEEILESGRHRLGDPAFRSGALPHVSRYVAFVKEQNIFDAEMLRLRYLKYRREPSPLEIELIQVFDDYQRALQERGLEDREGERARLYTGLLTGSLDPARVFPSLRKLVVEGIYRVSALEAAILNLLKERLEELEASIGDLETPEWGGRRPEWRFLDVPDLRWVVHPAPRKIPARVFVRPANREEEALWATREISRLKSESADLDWSSIAVVCTRPSDYRPFLDEIFAQFGIPYFFPAGRSARESAAAASLLKYLRALAEDFSPASLFDLLSDPHLRVPECTPEDVAALEPIARRIGGAKGAEFWEREFPGLVDLYSRELSTQKPRLAQNLKGAATALAQAVSDLKLSLDPKRPLTEWRSGIAERLIPFWSFPDFAPETSADGEKFLWRAFWLDLTAAVRGRGSRGDLSFEHFAGVVGRQLGSTRTRSGQDRDAVVVATPGQLQQGQFRHLFWLGLAEGEFPENPTQHIFFDDVRSSQWGFFGWEDRLDESRWLFRLLTASVREKLHLSCPTRIGDAPALPSTWLRDLALTDSETAPPPPDFAALRLPLSGPARRNVKRGTWALDLRESDDLSVFQGAFQDPGLLDRFRRAVFPGAMTLSPSQLESYLRCGFRFFLQRVVRISGVDGEEGEITPRERGNLIHKVLFRFMAEGFEPPTDFSQTTREVWTDGQRRRMHRILKEELERVRPDGRWREYLFGSYEEDRLAAGLVDESDHGLLAEFVNQQWERLQSFRVEALELELGPIELGAIGDPREGRLTPVRLRGKIDRIDALADELFLIDYKTGLDQHPRVYDGWGFQLPLYVWMAGKWLRRPVVGAAFYTIRTPREVRLTPLLVRADGDPMEGLRRLADYYRGKALEAAGHLHRGRFPVTLLGRSKAGCQSCDFRRVCRLDTAQAERLRAAGGFPVDEKIVERGNWLSPDAPESSVGG